MRKRRIPKPLEHTEKADTPIAPLAPSVPVVPVVPEIKIILPDFDVQIGEEKPEFGQDFLRRAKEITPERSYANTPGFADVVVVARTTPMVSRFGSLSSQGIIGIDLATNEFVAWIVERTNREVINVLYRGRDLSLARDQINFEMEKPDMQKRLVKNKALPIFITHNDFANAFQARRQEGQKAWMETLDPNQL